MFNIILYNVLDKTFFKKGKGVETDNKSENTF